MLVFHAAAFVFGDASAAAGYCRQFGDAGYDSVSVDYPSRDYFAALRYSEREASVAEAKGLPTYAVGWSSGGNLAAMLAAFRDVDAAVAISAPTNLLNWHRNDWYYYRKLIKLPTWAARRRASPFYRYRSGLSCPLLLMHSRPDRQVRYWQSLRFARRSHLRLITLKGGHLQDQSSLPRALRWLKLRHGTRCAMDVRQGAR